MGARGLPLLVALGLLITGYRVHEGQNVSNRTHLRLDEILSRVALAAWAGL